MHLRRSALLFMLHTLGHKMIKKYRLFNIYDLKSLLSYDMIILNDWEKTKSWEEKFFMQVWSNRRMYLPQISSPWDSTPSNSQPHALYLKMHIKQKNKQIDPPCQGRSVSLFLILINTLRKYGRAVQHNVGSSWLTEMAALVPAYIYGKWFFKLPLCHCAQ